jgi:chromate reductase
VGASNGAFGAVWAQAETRKVLAAMGARVVGEEVPVGRASARLADDGRLLDGELEERVRDLLGELVAAVEERAALAA